MGRKGYLNKPRQINIVLEEELLKELDRIAGANNRSATIRELIRDVKGDTIREVLELRRENRDLKRALEAQGKRIEELERRMRAQTEKDAGKMADSKREQIEKYYRSYEQWRNGLEKNNRRYSFERGIMWIEPRARRVGKVPEKLLTEFEERWNTEQSGEQWDHT